LRQFIVMTRDGESVALPSAATQNIQLQADLDIDYVA
jgi:hypothetical protein